MTSYRPCSRPRARTLTAIFALIAAAMPAARAASAAGADADGPILADLGARPESAPAGAPAGLVADLLARRPTPTDESLWPTVEELSRLGEAAAGDLEAASRTDALPRRDRIACAAALLRLGHQREGALGLEKIVLDHEAHPADRLEAAEYLGGSDGGEYASARLGLLANLDTLPERVRVALAAGLLRQAHRGQGVLETLYHAAKSQTARDEAMLALASVERNPQTYAADLARLADRPGPLGDRARAQQAVDVRFQAESGRDEGVTHLIREVIDLIRHTYNKDETDPDADKKLLAESMGAVAARAILQSIDPYNDYLDEEDLAAFDEKMRGHYGGIGAWVGLRDHRFTILTPMYNQPAQRAGLRPMDVVLQIGDLDIKDLVRERKQNDIIKLLKGEPGTAVKLKIIRRGWNEPVWFNVKREMITLESVEAQLLPGKIGFLRISEFNDGDPGRKILGTSALVQKHLADFNRAGVRGVVLDLTNNPGGLLIAAVDTARQFIGERKIIVSSRGRPDAPRRPGGQEDFRALLGQPPCRLPMVAMVNGGSASAAEILAGALRDHGRAKLVGQKTFGKGSVQQAINVQTTSGKTNIKLTIAKYYLPSGVSIHRQGIKPDIEVAEPSISAAEAEARFRLRDDHEVQFWLEEGDPNRWDREQQRLRDLLAYDAGDPDRYPGLDELLDRVKGKHPRLLFDREILRKEIRVGVASYLRDFLGEKWFVDWVDYYTLQEALLALGEDMGGLPDEPAYQGMRERVEKNRQRAAEEKRDAIDGEDDLPGE